MPSPPQYLLTARPRVCIAGLHVERDGAALAAAAARVPKVAADDAAPRRRDAALAAGRRMTSRAAVVRLSRERTSVSVRTRSMAIGGPRSGFARYQSRASW